MIVFTGSGKISELFHELYPSNIVSARNLSDDELKKVVKDARTVIHNSALIHSTNLDDYTTSNFLLTRRLVKICEEVNPEVRFIYLSSMSFLASDNTCLPVDQMTDYAYSKFITENYCFRCGLKNLTSVRFSTIFYGNAEKDGISKMILDAIVKNEIIIYNNGMAKRDIIPLRILVKYLHNLCNVKSVSRKYNIVSGRETSFLDVVNILLNHFPNLKITNREIETPNVLSTFSKQDVISLGEINFDLEEEIELYIRSNN